MKIRTDFVTNSSSSSFVAMTITTIDGSEKSFELEDCSWGASQVEDIKYEDGKIIWESDSEINNVKQLLIAFYNEGEYYEELEEDFELGEEETEYADRVEELKNIEKIGFCFHEYIRGSLLEPSLPYIDGNTLNGEEFIAVSKDDPTFEKKVEYWTEKLFDCVQYTSIDSSWPEEQVRKYLPEGNLQAVIDEFDCGDYAEIETERIIKLKK